MMISSLFPQKPSYRIGVVAMALAWSGLLMFGATPEATKDTARNPASNITKPDNASTPTTESKTEVAALTQRSRSRGSRGYTSRSGGRQQSGARATRHGNRGARHGNRGGNRGHRGHRGHRGNRVYYLPYGFGLGYYYSGLYAYGGYYGPHGYYGGYRSYYGGHYGRTGAIDLNVKPKKAQVYLDGHFIGKAGKFDGWPSHLFLEEGSYELIFYLEGHETLRKEYKVHKGIVIKEDLTLSPGESTPPELLTQKTIATREPAAVHAEEDQPTAKRRYRVRHGKTRLADRAPIETGDVDFRDEPSRLDLAVYPSDASVYLDGRFLGTGNDLSRWDGDVIVDSGEHVIEVVRPGFQTETKTIHADEGARIQLKNRSKKRINPGSKQETAQTPKGLRRFFLVTGRLLMRGSAIRLMKSSDLSQDADFKTIALVVWFSYLWGSTYDRQ